VPDRHGGVLRGTRVGAAVRSLRAHGEADGAEVRDPSVARSDFGAAIQKEMTLHRQNTIAPKFPNACIGVGPSTSGIAKKYRITK
jgi:hypothetical protein